MDFADLNCQKIFTKISKKIQFKNLIKIKIEKKLYLNIAPKASRKPEGRGGVSIRLVANNCAVKLWPLLV